jgi:hypothetical protein
MDFDSVDSWLAWPADDPAEDGPDDGLVDSVASRLVGAADGAARSDDGALCWMVEPADGASRLVPVPCALAKPVPAISAAAATEIIKRLVMEFSSHVCIARADNESICVRFLYFTGSIAFVS